MSADTSLITAVGRFQNEEVSEAWFVEDRLATPSAAATVTEPAASTR